MSQINAGDQAINRLNTAVSAFEDIMTAPEGALVGVPNHPPQPSVAERVKQALDALTESPAESASKALQSELNAKASEISARADADRAQLANPDNWESAPYPDVWIPFNDSLKMEAGFGTYDTIKVGTDTINLPSRSVTFTRASTATYIDKSGVLQTAAINAPRFEKEGLLIEGQSTNLVLSSEASGSDAKFTYTANGEWTTFLSAVADSTYNFVSTTPLVGTFTAGDVYTISVWVTENTCTGPLRLRALDVVPNPDHLDYPAGYTGRMALTFTAGGSTKLTPAIYLNAFGMNPLGTKITVGRWQVEKLPFATSYIKTTGAAATRVADAVKIQETGNIPAQTALSVCCEIGQWASSKQRSMFLSGRAFGYVYQDTANKNVTYKPFSSIQQSFGGIPALARGLFAVAADPSASTIKCVINGDLQTRQYAPMNNAPLLQELWISTTSVANSWGATDSNLIELMHVRNLRIWHRALTDAQLKSLR